MRVMMEIHAHPIPAAAEIASILRIARVRIPTADALPVQTASTEIIIAPETPALIR